MLEVAARTKPAFLVVCSARDRHLPRDPIGRRTGSGRSASGRSRRSRRPLLALSREGSRGGPLQVGEFDSGWRRRAGSRRMHARAAGRGRAWKRRAVDGHDAAYSATMARCAGAGVQRGRLRERAHGAASCSGRVAGRALRPGARPHGGAAEVIFHGEFYASNMMVHRAPEGVSCPVDWEMAGVGPGLIDLAALVSRTLGSRRAARARVAPISTSSGADRSRRPTREADLQESLAWCRLHVVQWLGWSEHWSPPKEHAHDWLRGVSELAKTLEL